jgi:hypothetical protein
MVRATAVEVVKKWGGTNPPGWDATSVGNVCTQVDAEIDGRASPSVFGTSTNFAEFANELVYRRINHANWSAAGGVLSGSPEPRVWSEDLVDWFNALLTDTTTDTITTIKLQDSS